MQIYTSFGYGGVGTPARVKKEVALLLRAEGKTWNEVVRESVERLALKEAEAEARMPVLAYEKGGVAEMIMQAEEISRRLDVVGKMLLLEQTGSASS